MAFVIAIIVIGCMAATFASLFFMYGKTKSRGIAFGVEDEKLRNILLTQRLKYNQTRQKDLSVKEYIAVRRQKEKNMRIVADVLFILLMVIVVAISAAVIAYRAQGENFRFGGKSYFTIYTGSMEDKNEKNSFLAEHDDGVRITQYSLICIEETDTDSLREGDIIAFRVKDTIYVHRIVKIKENGSEKLFTTMGDANATSFLEEIDFTADHIVGRFNGYQNWCLGVILIYLQSNIGIISLVFMFLMLAVIDLSQYYITRSYERRLCELGASIDQENAGLIDTNGENHA